jgi:hypothetical protein
MTTETMEHSPQEFIVHGSAYFTGTSRCSGEPNKATTKLHACATSIQGETDSNQEPDRNTQWCNITLCTFTTMRRQGKGSCNDTTESHYTHMSQIHWSPVSVPALTTELSQIWLAQPSIEEDADVQSLNYLWMLICRPLTYSICNIFFTECHWNAYMHIH